MQLPMGGFQFASKFRKIAKSINFKFIRKGMKIAKSPPDGNDEFEVFDAFGPADWSQSIGRSQLVAVNWPQTLVSKCF